MRSPWLMYIGLKTIAKTDDPRDMTAFRDYRHERKQAKALKLSGRK